jgi:protein-tyrosine phosphatase
MKILMVCLGNICRSPLAEGILKHYIKREKLDWFVDSAGTGAWHIGNPPDPRSIELAKKHGIDISDQRARKIRSTDFEEFDIIFAMDSSNYNDLQRYALDDEEKEKIKFILNETKPNQNNSVPDPYWDDNGFEKVYQMLDIACKSFIEKHR